MGARVAWGQEKHSMETSTPQNMTICNKINQLQKHLIPLNKKEVLWEEADTKYMNRHIRTL